MLRKLLLGAMVAVCGAVRDDVTSMTTRPISSRESITPTVRRSSLPLRFEANLGQWDPRVRFVARGGGATFGITDDGMKVHLCEGRPRSAKKQRTLREPKCAAVTFTLEGAHPAQPLGESPLATKSNFFLGNDPKTWRTNVPNYAQVRAKDALPGVTIVWHGGPVGLEYDLDVAAGVDARAVTFVIDGARSLHVAADRSLEIVTAAGTLAQKPPRVTQGDHEVSARYRTDGVKRVWLELDAYDRSRPVLIDPMLVYSSYLGGTGIEVGHAIAVDSAGAAYVVGSTRDGGFPTTVGAYETQYKTSPNDTAFVAKLDASGSSLVYATYLGGSYEEEGYGVAVDVNGAVYVTGLTGSPDFPTTPGAYEPSLPQSLHAFVTKLESSGASLVYSTYLGGAGGSSTGEIAYGITVDATGAAYVVGLTSSPDFPTTASAYQSVYAGGGDVFVTKLNAQGSSLVYSTYLGGASDDVAKGVAIDSSGAAYVAGTTTSSNFPTTLGAYNTSYKKPFWSDTYAFIAKLDASGSSLQYSTYLGGTITAIAPYDAASELCTGIAVDSNGAAYVTGTTQSADFPTTTGSFEPSCEYAGKTGITYVSKLDATGASLEYSTFLGCGVGIGNGIAVDSRGNAYVTGWTEEPDFPTTPGAFQSSKHESSSPFVTKLNPLGSLLAYSTYFGGGDIDEGNAITVDSSGDAYVTGLAQSTDFPTTQGAAQTSIGGLADAFVAKLTQPKLPPATTCTLAEQCASGFCVDGVCCDTPCSGQCEACDVAGSVGQCTAATGAPHGSRAACDACGSCDGTTTSACSEAAAAAVCGTSCCAAPNVCDPSGACVPPTSGCSCETTSRGSLPWGTAIVVFGVVSILNRRRQRDTA